VSDLVSLRSARAAVPRELAVVSGKGGTGKTSLVASLAALSGDCVVADCDVDAADLHLILAPRTTRREAFTGGSRARIKSGHCIACGKCEELCRFEAIRFDGPGNGEHAKTFRVDPLACEGCGVCAWFCAERAIEFGPVESGAWYVSETRLGTLVHAKLGVAGENSGKLVSTVRTAARQAAEEQGRSLVLIDGPPGVGCPVIASITGADLVLVVTEPTPSGLHDLERVLRLARHFGIPVMAMVNKWDLNEALCERVAEAARQSGAGWAGRVRYDRAATAAQLRGETVVEFQNDGCARDIRTVWENVRARLGLHSPPVVRACSNGNWKELVE